MNLINKLYGSTSSKRQGSHYYLFQEYNFGLAQYFGAGIMACIRGSRIYDSLDTKIIVQKWIRFYKVRIKPC